MYVYVCKDVCVFIQVSSLPKVLHHTTDPIMYLNNKNNNNNGNNYSNWPRERKRNQVKARCRSRHSKYVCK